MRRLMMIAVALLVAGDAPAEARCVEGREVAADMRGRIAPDGKRWNACLDSRKPVRVSARKPTLARVASPHAAAIVSRTLILVDLRRGTRRTARLPGRASDLVLGNSGSAAFVAGGKVRRLDADGTSTPLDEGAITTGSLAVSRAGHFVYWMKDGVPRSAAFPAAREERAGVQRRCAPRGKRQYAADADARVYDDGDEILACLGDHGRRFPFFVNGNDYYGFTVAAPFATMVGFALGPYTTSNEIGVVDLRDGSSYEHELGSTAQQFVLTDRGTTVILQDEPRNADTNAATGPPSIQRFERGKLTQVDAGAIADASLALTPDGRRVYWTKDGVARTLRL